MKNSITPFHLYYKQIAIMCLLDFFVIHKPSKNILFEFMSGHLSFIFYQPIICMTVKYINQSNNISQCVLDLQYLKIL
jgi:hypothetical protein